MKFTWRNSKGASGISFYKVGLILQSHEGCEGEVTGFTIYTGFQPLHFWLEFRSGWRFGLFQFGHKFYGNLDSPRIAWVRSLHRSGENSFSLTRATIQAEYRNSHNELITTL